MNRRRAAFTLIELLVVIAIVAILIALLLPAVQKVREVSLRLACLNNLKQISLAMHNYHDVEKTLPMGGTKYHGSGTWQVAILPYVEQENLRSLYQGYDGGSAQISGAWSPTNVANVTGAAIKVFTCPADTPAKSAGQTYGGTAYFNYAVNFGNTAAADSFNTGVMRIETTFNGLTYQGSPFRFNEAVSIQSIQDGASNTLMLAEVIQGRGQDLRGFTWWGDAAGFIASLRPNDSNPDFVTHNYCDTNPPNPPANCYGQTTADNFAIRAFASRSRHRTGVHVSFCDGSNRWIKNSITPQAWQAMSTTNGSEASVAD